MRRACCAIGSGIARMARSWCPCLVRWAAPRLAQSAPVTYLRSGPARERPRAELELCLEQLCCWRAVEAYATREDMVQLTTGTTATCRGGDGAERRGYDSRPQQRQRPRRRSQHSKARHGHSGSGSAGAADRRQARPEEVI